MGNFFASETIARQALELAPIVRAMKHSGLSDRKIALALNAMGIRTWENKPFDTRAAYSLRRRVDRLCLTCVGKRSGDKLSTLDGSSSPAPERPWIAQNGRG